MSNKTYEARKQLETIFHTMKEQLDVRRREVTLTTGMAQFILPGIEAVLNGEESFEKALGITPKTGSPAIDPSLKRQQLLKPALKAHEVLIRQRKVDPSYTIDQALKKAASSTAHSYNQYREAWSYWGGLEGVEILAGLNNSTSEEI